MPGPVTPHQGGSYYGKYGRNFKIAPPSAADDASQNHPARTPIITSPGSFFQHCDGFTDARHGVAKRAASGFPFVA